MTAFHRRSSPMRLWAIMLVTAAERLCSCGWYRGWYCGLYWGCAWAWPWGCGLASPCERVEEAEEEVEEPRAERVNQDSGLCKLGLTWDEGPTTEDCLRTADSSSDPDEESKGRRDTVNAKLSWRKLLFERLCLTWWSASVDGRLHIGWPALCGHRKSHLLLFMLGQGGLYRLSVNICTERSKQCILMEHNLT